MKWNMVFGALVVSVGLCSQSFGFELLDRMLGLNDCGCNSCCQKACEPSCGCDKGCEPSCCAAPACEPSCCAAPSCNPCRRHGHGLLHGLHDRLFGCHQHCNQGCGGCAEPACAAAPACEPTCCAAPACNACESCCKPRCHRRLLDIFRCHRSSCNACDTCNSCESACGCGAGSAGGAVAPADDAAPMPPAPAADPSASIQSKRRMVSTNSKVVRRN